MMRELKIHIGCGTVYLEGYINVHPKPDGLACVFPEEVERNKTTVDNYYKDNFDARPKFAVADLKATINDLPYLLSYQPNNLMDTCINIKQKTIFCNGDDLYPAVAPALDEICMFHVLEHIPKYDLDKNLKIISKLLKPGGRFRVAVPDIDGFVLEFAKKLIDGITEEEKEWYYRCIYGTQKDQWSHHYCGYNKQRLQGLLGPYGFVSFKELPNQNFYPSIHLLAFKHAP